MVDAFADLLGRSVAALSDAIPSIYLRLANGLRGLPVSFVVDGARSGIVSEAGTLRVEPVTAPEVEVVTDGETVLGLVDGKQSLLEAAYTDALMLKGDPRQIITFDDALRIYLNGAVRVPRVRALVGEYRRHVMGTRRSSASAAEVRAMDPKQKDINSVGKVKDEQKHGTEAQSQYPPKDCRTAVTVFGAGVAGLTVAHELVERGFRVQVWEPTWDPRGRERGCAVGGMARSQWSRVDRPLVMEGVPAPPSENWAEREAIPLRFLNYSFFIDIDPKDPGAPLVDKSVEIKVRDLVSEVLRRRLGVVYAETIHDDRWKDEFSGIVRRQLESVDARLKQVGKVSDSAKEVTYQIEENGEKLKVKLYLKYLKVHDPRLWFDPEEHLAAVRFRVREYQLPGEHGYRFFPAFYHHLFDTLKRIPILKPAPKSELVIAQESSSGVDHPDVYALVETGRTVFDNLMPSSSQAIAYGDGHRPPVFPRFQRGSFEQMLRQIRTLFRWRLEPETRGDAVIDWRRERSERQRLRARKELREQVRPSGMGITPRDLARFNLRLVKFLGSCPARRRVYERMSWWEYLDADTFSPAFQRGQNEWPRALIAMSALEVDARTHGDATGQLLLDQIRPRGYRDGVLNGPTSTAWFDHWKRYLQGQGVDFVTGKITGFQWVTSAVGAGTARLLPIVERIDGGEARLMDGYFVLALPVHQAQRVVQKIEDAPNDIAIGRDLARLQKLGLGTWIPNPGAGQPDQPTLIVSELDEGHSDQSPLRNFHGIQFYFDEEPNWLEGHTFFAHAPWGLSAVSQSRFWSDAQTWDSGYRGVISVIIGVWNKPGLLKQNRAPNRTAWQIPPAELAEEVWFQIRESVRSAPQYGPEFALPEPRFWRLNDDLEWLEDQGHYRNRNPFLICRPGEWASRPGEVPTRDRDGEISGGFDVYHGIVVAGTYTKTFTRLTSMEAANESGRHAANAILQHANLAALKARAPVWDIEEREMEDLLWLKELDARYLARGLDHPLDDPRIEESIIASMPGVLRHPDSRRKEEARR